MEAALDRAVAALDAGRVSYALMGGLASAAMGRARHTHDVDLFVTPDDADRALDRLAAAGFRTERTDPRWLYKAYWSGTMVDVIFASKGGILFDADMRGHLRRIRVRGRNVQTVSPEDMLVIKALASAEHVPRHWHDALALIAAGGLDWPYLVKRARPHAPRVLSLLLYALSDGLPVPLEPVQDLFEIATAQLPVTPDAEARHHLAAHVRRALATDPRVNEPEVMVIVDDDVVVRGQVATASRRQAIQVVLRELVGEERLRNEVEVLDQ